MSNIIKEETQHMEPGSSDTPLRDLTPASNSDTDRNTSDSNNSRRGRPKRTSSKNIDYDLKKPRIIPSDNSYQSINDINDKDTNIKSEEEDKLAKNNVKVIETNKDGKIIKINDEEILSDTKNGATGLSLSQVPPEKMKKESFWNYKKIVLPEEYKDFDLKNNKYLSMLKTRESENLTSTSIIRPFYEPTDIHFNERTKSLYKYYESNGYTEIHQQASHNKSAHVIKKVKDTILKESKSKLFGQSSISAEQEISTKNADDAIDNDDFCSTCLQSGSFLCCDTCPRSFHFLCLNPPLDPDNLPEGDWSCPQCIFKAKNPNITSYKKSERDYICTLPNGNKLFGKLLFGLQAQNTRQFKLPNGIKDTFEHVRSNSRGQYQDEREKAPLTERQIFGTPYGQSITKLDSYTPETHIDPETGEFLLCYKCGTTRMGTWDDYETTSRLIMKCDYCLTPWHLNCLPEVPRASLKNLGRKWKCPLHVPEYTSTFQDAEVYRRLSRNQKYIEPLHSSGFKNNGDIEILPNEIIEPVRNCRINENYKQDILPPVPIIHESSIKLDFLDKISKAKKARKFNYFKTQEILIDKLINAPRNLNYEETTTSINDISSLLYFKLGDSELKKLWNFKELCSIAKQESSRLTFSEEELQQFLIVKKILESKPKEEVLKFFNIDS